MGSRSLSHDSIFLADQCQSDPEPPRVFSQENIHGKIRTLQVSAPGRLRRKQSTPPPPWRLQGKTLQRRRLSGLLAAETATAEHAPRPTTNGVAH
uniref:Uncharacterized protein n=1 Tax=Electrophorus electricus TaxID=8005 RepID=A0AAY5EJF8_ELEEL